LIGRANVIVYIQKDSSREDEGKKAGFIGESERLPVELRLDGIHVVEGFIQ
jgi:hypothetical protein